MNKVYFQIICFVLFSISYLVIVNLHLLYRGTANWIFVPGTLLVGLAGYWIGGYLYVRYFS